MQTEHAAPEADAGAANAKDWDWNSAYWRALGAPWGGGHCSAEDIATFLHSFMHLPGKALREETVRLMIRNHTEGLGARRGIGFALGPDGFGKGCSERSFGHNGSTGMLAWAEAESDTICVILTSLPSSVCGVGSRRRKVGDTNSGAQSRAPCFDSHRFPSKWISSATFLLALSEIPGADFPPIP